MSDLEDLIAAMAEVDDLEDLEEMRARAVQVARNVVLAVYRENRTRIRRANAKSRNIIIEVNAPTSSRGGGSP